MPHPRSGRLRLAALGLAALSLITVSACSSAVSENGGGAKSNPASAPQDGGTLVVAQSSDADPSALLNTSVGNILSEYSVFETLTQIRDGQPHGVLAQSWKLSSDGKSMDIKLRSGVTFHSGAPLTSKDVIYTIKKVQDPASAAANLAIAAQITGMKALNDTELTLTFAKPLPNIFDLFETMPIVNPALYDQYKAGKVVDGTGPFEWTSWTPNGRLVLTKYAKYRDAADIHLNKIEINIITDPTAIVSAIRSGRVEYGTGLAALDSYRLSKESGYNLITSGGSAIPLGFDTTKAPFNDKRVRQAVQYAIDRDRINQQVESGQATPTSLPWRESTVGYDQAQSSHYAHDVTKAKDLLKEAGVSNATFDMVSLDTPEATGIFQIVKNDLEEIGLHAKAKPLSATDYDARLAKGDMGAPAFLMMASNGLSPASAVVSRPELKADGNPEHFKQPEYTKLVNDVTTAVGTSAQTKALHAWNDYFLDQAFAVPLVIRPTMTVSTSAVHGITSTQMGFIDLNHAWLDKN